MKAGCIMHVKVYTVSFLGLNPIEVTIEVSIVARGLPSFDIVGLPTKSLEESKHRIKSAFVNSGTQFPNKKIVVNLAPANIKKDGTYFDLGIAVGIYLASNLSISPEEKIYLFGELSLDGGVRSTNGAYLFASYLAGGGATSSLVLMPKDTIENHAHEFGQIKNLFLIDSLISAIQVINTPKTDRRSLFCSAIASNLTSSSTKVPPEVAPCLFDEIIGQEFAKRALEISAAGMHSLFLSGPPGIGKSMLAKSLVDLLPNIEFPEDVELKKLYSYIGVNINNFAHNRPFRSPHNSISYSGMLGGGSLPEPGEVSLAHKGILFMDEFCEFSKNVLEGLRQPIQDKFVTIKRAGINYTFPCDFVLVGAANPCPCGYYGVSTHACTCASSQLDKYRRKLSGPIIDRIDLFVELSSGIYEQFAPSDTKLSTVSSAIIKSSIKNAHATQKHRLARHEKFYNAHMTNAETLKYCELDAECLALLTRAVSFFKLSYRQYYKVLKVSRTIADLAQSDKIRTQHLSEALQYRKKL